MRECPLKYKECPLKHPLSGRVVCSFEIQVAKTTNGQKNASVEESNHLDKGHFFYFNPSKHDCSGLRVLANDTMTLDSQFVYGTVQ